MKRFYLLIPFLSILIFTTIQTVSANTWIEDFEEEHLDAWAVDKTSDKTTWQIKDGHMDVWIDPVQVDGPRSYSLEFIGFDFRAEKLSVIVTILEVENAQVGILIGQYTDDRNIFRRTYKILHGTIWRPTDFRGQNPKVNYKNLKEIEIVFNQGNFEVLSKGKHLLEFDEPNLPHIDCLGVIAYASKGPPAHFVLDDFIISGPSIPSNDIQDVLPRGKAAEIWGRLKGQ